MQTPEYTSKWNECWVRNGNNISLEWTPGKWEHLILEHNTRICFQLSGSPTWSTPVLPSHNRSQLPAVTALQITELVQSGQTSYRLLLDICCWYKLLSADWGVSHCKRSMWKMYKKRSSRESFQLLTDHKPLVPLINRKGLDHVPVTCQALLRA